MSMSDYLAELQATKTYKEGLIKVQEYKFITKFGGLYSTLPEIPRADNDRHIIVMELRGNQPAIRAVLTDSKQTVSLTVKDANKLLFIYVDMKPRTIRVEEEYRLRDGHKIDATFLLTYRIADAIQFWSGAKDPLTELEGTVGNEARNYFLSKTSEYLVESGVADDLQQSIRARCLIPGVTIEKVYADIYRSKEVSEYLTKAQDSPRRLRLDIAVPNKICVMQVFVLAVSVRQPSSSKLTDEGLSRIESEELQVEWPEERPFIRLRVQVSAPDCVIHGDNNQNFRLYLGQDSPTLLFHLSPEKQGRISIIVKVYQEDDWLGNAIVYTTSYQELVSTVEIEVTSHNFPHPLDSVKGQIVGYSRRLQKLREIQSIKGIDTEPHHLIEIEDIETRLEELKQSLV